MGVFLQVVLGFPTVIFTALLALVLLYWLVAASGLLELDALDHALLGDGGDGLDAGGLAALLNKVGLGRVPLTIIVSLIVLFGWVASFAMVRLLVPQTGLVLLQFVMGAAVFALALLAGLLATIVVLRPVRALLARVPPEESKVVLGRVGVVRSASATPQQGYASVEDGGAGLVLQVRTIKGELPRGTRVVLIEKLDDRQAWRVVSEEEFTGL
ncbi:ubiquinone biosynthesis protein UbiH [Corticibacter populi]|uniref:Ubiquinone biosynthesis protein UbiH n=1 Tax=Corticibacter populi TaxID=1550736 RepID=A0A3M6QT39_9BURK|nr:ubiquinone biosynthesis protein UbiH [Corticibacter populi]RMX06021.1 ubiquinone biosynthesis protein UbiH [Corticibacter populi]RZS31041.1 hypothetical protein EV687_3243 [Corticibacter populi]